MIKALLTTIITIILITSIATAVSQYKYMEGIEPHTRYNPLRTGCYYYYGYGSCLVNSTECQGVPVGQNLWVDLGDACGRNKAPSLINKDKTVNLGDDNKTIYYYLDTDQDPSLKNFDDITVREGETVVIKAECVDDDPVNMTITGWTNKKITRTTYKDAGTHTVTITCTDTFGESDSANIKVHVIDQNRPPIFKIIKGILNPKK